MCRHPRLILRHPSQQAWGASRTRSTATAGYSGYYSCEDGRQVLTRQSFGLTERNASKTISIYNGRQDKLSSAFRSRQFALYPLYPSNHHQLLTGGETRDKVVVQAGQTEAGYWLPSLVLGLGSSGLTACNRVFHRSWNRSVILVLLLIFCGIFFLTLMGGVPTIDGQPHPHSTIAVSFGGGRAKP